MKVKKGGEKIRGSMNKGEMFSGQKKEGSIVEAPKLAVRRRKAVRSVTREEIERYWRVKRMEEEEHLLAALKAAARIRARALSEEDYRRFEESLRDMIKKANEEKDGQNHKDLQVGIKDWWTKSRYAYLNQPAISKPIGEYGAPSKATAAYVPQKNCSYAPPPTCSPVPTSLGVF
ncbi:uncharacterized protein A4U43_C04F21830 [Asparagus officinalis]|uniref:Uncharacterized protein n=1 Tax=Asparagus officinalis TaxID=4686 RepID=A0A5P1F5H0_ASPOF|nr:uncharacterized protein LOC109837742 [Asparagus officinalis]ONK72667.1 uncharacterized protein A4U43_C04F21830 [Asparagus officinalis]